MLRNVSRVVGRKGANVRLFSSATALLVSGSLLAACSGTEDGETGKQGATAKVGITHQGAALTAQDNVDEALRGVLHAAAFITESQALASSLSSLTSDDVCSSTQEPTVCSTDANGTTTCTTPVETETCEPAEPEVTTEDLTETHADMVEALDKLMDTLKNDVFIEANLESDDGKVVIYKLPASLVCDSESSGDTVPEPVDAADEPAELVTVEPDPECLANFEKLQPRLRLSSPKEGDIDVGILLTAEKTNPVTLQLYSDRIGVETDLGELKATLDAAGEDTENLQDLDGVLRAELIRNSATSYSLRSTVVEDVHVAVGEPGKVVNILLAASSPTSELTLDGEARTIKGTLNYGALNVSGPLAAFADSDEYDDEGNLIEKNYTGDLDLVLGGLNGSLTFDGSTDVLNFKGIGLGDVSTSVKFNDDTIFQLDVNPEDGRRFDVKVESGENDTATLTFNPTLDVRALFDLAKLAEQLTDLDSAYIKDDLRLWFDGADPSIQVGSGDLKVLSGTLHIDSGEHPEAAVSVDPGMCLVTAETVEGEAAPASLAAALAAGVCE